MSQLERAYAPESTKATRESHEKPLRLYAELFVEHSPAAVWSCFCDLARWAVWSPICCGCRLTQPGELGLGSILEIRFKVVGLILTVPARVVQFNPPESMTWQGEKFGIRASHTYRFTPHNQGTLLCNLERLSGARFPLNRIIPVWYRLGRVGIGSLKGLRQELGQTGSRQDR